jgi:hypothetical protein
MELKRQHSILISVFNNSWSKAEIRVERAFTALFNCVRVSVALQLIPFIGHGMTNN